MSVLLVAGLLAALLGGSAAAAPEMTPDELVARINALLDENYVEPRIGAEAGARLRELALAGDLERYPSPGDLAGALTAELERFDRHFHVSWSGPNEEGAGAAFHDEEGEARWLRWSRLNNYGFRALERLGGNIGYLDLRYFEALAPARETAAAAMAFLANSDAVIVDLRDNGGGEPEMVQFLISHFFPEGGIHYNTLYYRPDDHTHELATLDELPGRRMADRPLVVLTAPRTGSAAEAFAYSLQALGRATVIGERTAGAANPGETFPIGGGFSIFISTGKAINPVTGGSWERVGVRPDVRVAPEAALNVAHEHLIETLLDSAEGAVERRILSWTAEALAARRRPIVLKPELLERYAGVYGTRSISLVDGELRYRRGRRRQRVMVPLADDLFFLEGVDGFRTRFEVDSNGRGARLVDMWSDGHEESQLRERPEAPSGDL